VISADDGVVVSLASANRDEVGFDRPNELKIGRNGTWSHLTFGHGVRQCLGLWPARAELPIAVRTLVSGYPPCSRPYRFQTSPSGRTCISTVCTNYLSRGEPYGSCG
jgi:cytochrome P450